MIKKNKAPLPPILSLYLSLTHTKHKQTHMHVECISQGFSHYTVPCQFMW